MAQEAEKTEHVTKIIVQNNMSNALGIASFVFGLISIFFLAPVFVPLALLLGIIAIIRRQLAWGIIGIICSIIGFATSPILLGIFGLVSLGTVGLNLENNNKALSQNEPQKTYTPSPLPQSFLPPQVYTLSKNNSDPIIGKWSWFNGDRHEFLPNGNIAGNPRSYWASIGNNTYRITWDSQWIDTVTISGKALSGNNNTGTRVTGAKLENSMSSDNSIVGKWSWFNGDRHEFLPNGNIAGNPNSYWMCINSEKGLYRIVWGSKWIDTVRLNNNTSISGTNQVGHTVTGTKFQ